MNEPLTNPQMRQLKIVNGKEFFSSHSYFLILHKDNIPNSKKGVTRSQQKYMGIF